jgi:hypothetical protein
MKVQTFLIILMTIITIWSCDQDNDLNAENLTAVELKNSDVYEYEIGISGDEEGALISKQAEHYEVSEIVRDSSTQWEAVYRYKPQENYAGNDYVEIETHRGSDGASPSTDIELIKIEFTVTDQKVIRK